MHHRRVPVCLVALVWLTACGTSRAQQSPIAGLLYDEAYLVAHVDVEKVQLPPLYAALDRIVELAGLPRQQSAQQFVTALGDAGGKEVFVVLSGSPAGFVFVPHVPDANAEMIGSVLAESPFRDLVAIETTDRIAGGVAAGTRSMLLHLQNLKAKPSPHLASALAATRGCTQQVLLLPTDQNRARLEEFALYPAAAETAAEVKKRIAWASIGVDGPPQSRLKMVFEANDAGAADALKAALDRSLEPLLTHVAVRKNVALVENLRAILDWRQAGNTLSLDVDDRQGELTVVARGMLRPALEADLSAAARELTMQHLKEIGLALLNHHDVYKKFPAPARLDGEGKPLLSWRVSILPFIDQAELYKRFHLDEPWDSPHNKPLLAEMPDTYRCPLARVGDDHTIFLTPRGGGSVFAGPDAKKIRDITDGTSKTIAVVEADDAHAVPWTKPDDWPLDPDQPTAGLGQRFPGVFLSLFCDGSAHALPETIDPDKLRQLITCAGREPVSIP